MKKRTITAILALTALCILNARAHAQSASCYMGVQVCIYDTGGTLGNVVAPTPPANSVCGSALGGCVMCSFRTSSHDYGCAPTNVMNDCPG